MAHISEYLAADASADALCIINIGILLLAQAYHMWNQKIVKPTSFRPKFFYLDFFTVQNLFLDSKFLGPKIWLGPISFITLNFLGGPKIMCYHHFGMLTHFLC